MGKSIINTFSGGINCDIDKSLISNRAYLDAHNFRIITTTGRSSGSLENIKGNHLLEGTGGFIDSGQFIIGSCEIRDKLVLFTTDNESATPTAGISQIYTVEINLGDETQVSLTKIYEDSVSLGYLKFSTAYPIKAVARYETPNIQKVYWTDGYNNVRYCNIVPNLLTTTVDKFEFLPNFTFNKPTLKNVVGGNVNTGMIAYAYQLYVANGAETAFSALSDPIHVNSDSDFLSNTLSYAGDKEKIDSGKGFVMTVYNSNIGYNRLRLVRVEYSTLNALPRIYIANEIIINTTVGSIDVTDTGDVLGEITIDEFNISSTELFTCKDLTTKDNILFAANISKSEFVVDPTFDCRAVRFKNNSGIDARLDDSAGDGSRVTILPDFSNWVDYGFTHDGINITNNPDEDDHLDLYIYCADGITFGAEGPKIKIDFATEDFVIDNSQNDATFYVDTPSNTIDISYRNYASPWKDGKLSWQRDEVYRLFVVWGNECGQTSDAKWIIDLRMPSFHVDTFLNSDGDSVFTGKLSEEDENGEIHSWRLYPRVYFKDFPSNATWAQIYRVKRERKDRSIVTQGLVIPTWTASENLQYRPEFWTNIQPVDGAGRLIKLVSPEINITKNISKLANDYLELVVRYELPSPTVGTLIPVSEYRSKCKTNTRVLLDLTTGRSEITDAIYISPEETQDIYVTIDGKQYNNYYYKGPMPAHIPGKGCSGLLIAYENESWDIEGERCNVINYRSRVYGSQYGGYTFEDRNNNVSIPCSNVIRITDVNTNWINAEYGDTYINYFDVALILADLAQSNDNGYPPVTTAMSTYAVLESSINCDLRHDKESPHITYNNMYGAMRQEYLGSHQIESEGSGMCYFEQETNLYQYNTVYSQQLDLKYAVVLPVDKIYETVFDCMIKASNKKTNGELSDSWSKFGINEFIEVDSTHGPVNAVYTFNDKLVYFQNKAFGSLAVNDRSLINDNASAQLVLGTGGVLDRFDYVSVNAGCKDKFSIVSSKSGVYWYDRLLNTIYRYSDSLTDLLRVKSVKSYFDTSDVFKHTFRSLSHTDAKNDEVLFTFMVETETNGFTISYNEVVDAFVSFYDYVPILYIPFNQRYLTTTNSNYRQSQSFDRDRLFVHDSSLVDRCYFYGLVADVTANYVNSTVETLFNPEFESTKVFDNLFYISNSSSLTSDIFGDTFTSVRCYNDYQNTSTITLTPGTNLERRERTWSLVVPRNAVNANVSSNPTITSAVDTGQLFKERMRDKYLVAIFTYTNGTNNYRFAVTNLGMKYRTSER